MVQNEEMDLVSCILQQLSEVAILEEPRRSGSGIRNTVCAAGCPPRDTHESGRGRGRVRAPSSG